MLAYVPPPFPKAKGPGETNITLSTSLINFILSVAIITISGIEGKFNVAILDESNGISVDGYNG